MAASTAWTRGDLIDMYEQAGVEAAEVADWPAADLLQGLLAECCYVDLEQIVAGRLTQCAFPDQDHQCEHDVFRDVFALWTTGQLTPPEKPPTPPVFPPTRPRGNTVYAGWPKSELREMTTSQLRKIASLTWGPHETQGTHPPALETAPDAAELTRHPRRIFPIGRPFASSSTNLSR